MGSEPELACVGVRAPLKFLKNLHFLKKNLKMNRIKPFAERALF